MNQSILEAARNILVGEKNLNEGFFSDLVNSAKVSTELVKYGKNLKFDENTDINKIIQGGLDIIRKSKLSNSLKDTMERTYLKGIWEHIKKINTNLSGNEIKDKLNISSDLYADLINSVNEGMMQIEEANSHGKKVEDLENKIQQTKDVLRKYEEELSTLESMVRKSVQMDTSGRGTTLTFDGKTYSVSKGGRGFTVKENGVVIAKEYRGSMNDLRLSIGLGRF